MTSLRGMATSRVRPGRLLEAALRYGPLIAAFWLAEAAAAAAYVRWYRCRQLAVAADVVSGP